MNPEERRKLDNSVIRLQVEVKHLDEKVEDGFSSLNKKIEDLITRPEFTPVKMIAYGLATAVLSSVLMAIMAKVLIK